MQESDKHNSRAGGSQLATSGGGECDSGGASLPVCARSKFASLTVFANAGGRTLQPDYRLAGAF